MTCAIGALSFAWSDLRHSLCFPPAAGSAQRKTGHFQFLYVGKEERSLLMKAPKEVLPLSEAVTHLLEECRMVLPGIQALFGFQLIAVFNSTFRESLSST